MEEKKIVTFDGLKKYDALSKEKMANDISASLESANTYTNQEVAKKSSVQICIWEEND